MCKYKDEKLTEICPSFLGYFHFLFLTKITLVLFHRMRHTAYKCSLGNRKKENQKYKNVRKRTEKWAASFIYEPDYIMKQV